MSVRLLMLAGSMRPNSCSLTACKVAAEFASAKGFQAEVLSVRELDLPLYAPERPIETFQNASAIQQYLDALRSADAFIWCSPAYHGTVTGAFKNALDFVEFLSHDDPPYLQGKPVGIVAINDCTPFAAMRESARELRAWVAPTHVEIPESEFTSDRQLTNPKAIGRLSRLVDELTVHAGSKKHSGL